MELIKHALKRARELGHVLPLDSPVAATAPVTRRHPAPPLPAGAPIVYTQTRLIPASPDYFQEHRVVAALEGEPAANAYNVLRTTVLQRMLANRWRSLGVTSATAGAGKTLTAVNLAVSLAREANHSVLLVDLDLRRPGLSGYFTNEALPGIGDYLLGEVPLGSVLFNPGIDRLVVLPGNRNQSLANVSELLSSPRMVQLAEELISRYPSRIVLYDLPPLLGSDQAMAFAPYVDAFLLVIEDGRTGQEDLRRAADQLGAANLVGTVLNKVEGEGPALG